MAKARNVVEEMVLLETSKAEAKHELFCRLAREETLSQEEWQYLDSLGLSRKEIDAGVAKQQSVMRHQRQAGTAIEYSTAQADVEDAEQQLREERPAIEQRIKEAQRELKAFEDRAAATKRRVSVMEAARKNLTRVQEHDPDCGPGAVLLPDYIVKRHSRECQAFIPQRMAVDNAESRMKQIERLLPQSGNNDEVLNYGQALRIDGQNPPFIHDRHRGGHYVPDQLVHLASWTSYKDDVLRPELADIEERLPALQAEYVAAKAKADECRNYYLQA